MNMRSEITSVAGVSAVLSLVILKTNID